MEFWTCFARALHSNRSIPSVGISVAVHCAILLFARFSRVQQQQYINCDKCHTLVIGHIPGMVACVWHGKNHVCQRNRAHLAVFSQSGWLFPATRGCLNERVAQSRTQGDGMGTAPLSWQRLHVFPHKRQPFRQPFSQQKCSATLMDLACAHASEVDHLVIRPTPKPTSRQINIAFPFDVFLPLKEPV